MIRLGDIINLIWVDGDKPIRIISEKGKTPDHRDSAKYRIMSVWNPKILLDGKKMKIIKF